jgi:hypothetical protein
MKKLTTYIIALVIALQLTGASVQFASAKTEPNTETKNTLITPKPTYLPGPQITTQEKSKGVREWLVTTILPGWTGLLVGFVGITAFLMLIISGVRYMTAYGDEEAAGSAKKMIIFSIVGLLLALFSYTIVRIIVNLKFL